MLFVLMFDRTSRILAEFWPNSRFEVRSNIIWSSAVHYITIVSFSKNHYTTHNRHVLLTQINWNLCLVMEYGICSHTNFFFYSTNIRNEPLISISLMLLSHIWYLKFLKWGLFWQLKSFCTFFHKAKLPKLLLLSKYCSNSSTHTYTIKLLCN